MSKSDSMEKREEIFRKADYLCAICGNSVFTYGTPQLAHRIPQRKHLIEVYGKEIIHHELNMKPTCCLECNARVSTGYNTNKILDVLLEIQDVDPSEQLKFHIERLKRELNG